MKMKELDVDILLQGRLLFNISQDKEGVKVDNITNASIKIILLNIIK